MGRDAKYRGTFGLSPQPVAGITFYQGGKPSEPSMEDMMEELDKSDIREARKEELLAKMEQRIKKIRGEKEGKPPIPNPKRYLVDPETGRIDIDEENGEYTYKDALLLSSSIKGKSGQYDDAVSLINAAKALAEGTKPSQDERKKEFFIDGDTGVIIHDPENGELTLSEARAISQSRRKPEGPQTTTYIDGDGNVHQVPLGQPVVIKQKESQQPGKILLLDPQTGETQEYESGKPIVIKVQPSSSEGPTTLVPLFDSNNQPILDKHGKPIFTNIEWARFQREEKRADDDHQAKTEMLGEVKNFMAKLAMAAQRYASRHE